MSSIIEGYNYDIFISYRQKDNKYDGWVTEFVDNLNRELESAFKDEVSVYFDINPNDGLLETHDVEDSLKHKLNCLIFLPVLSRTYCDPRAFAWDHEFKAFAEQASKDRFGLKVTLPNGNVANRILPIRINDLDATDTRLCESILGGVLRGVDFIYKESGVNRPLSSNEENPHDNLNHTIYRNQINKVALTIRDIIESLKATTPRVLSESRDNISNQIIEPFEKITPSEPKKVQTGNILEEVTGKMQPRKKRNTLVLGIFLILVIMFYLAFFLNRRSKIRWANEIALNEIEQLRNENHYVEAFNLAMKVDKYIPGEPKFKQLASSVIARLTVYTDPPGANVYFREYSDTNGIWKKLGTSPIDSLKVPNRTIYLIRIEKQGYENILAVTRTGIDTLFRKLFITGSIPTGMVYVDYLEGMDDEISGGFTKDTNGFFIDRYEVTNKQFKEFVDKGGYRNPLYWKNEFIKEGNILPWEKAVNEFVDKSGRPGPSTWEGGDYPEGQDNYPVSGVSWYEAAAYANFAGKDLPTLFHWGSAGGISMITLFSTAIGLVSNFNRQGPRPVGINQSINPFGAYDMAGNVREWCWNSTEIGRIVRGGAWNDATYLYSSASQLPSFDRSAKNGFRCVKYINRSKLPESAFRTIEVGTGRDYYKEKSVPENIFSLYKNLFLYDKKDLNVRIEKRDESPKDWVVEKITFDTSYGNERMISYLFLPVKASPPLQVLIFFPGASAIAQENIFFSSGPMSMLDFIVKNGRAIMIPIYKGTYDRFDGVTTNIPNHTHQYTEDLIKWVKDFSRSVDYLETRSDIDNSKIGFIGFSWGGRMGGIIPAIENRLKLSVLIVGGFNFRTSNFPYPEAEELNYVPRIKIPVLMLNGRYDYNFPFETTVKPFYDLLGTPEKDKLLKIYDTDHYVPKSEIIKETIKWLDKYFGSVNYMTEK